MGKMKQQQQTDTSAIFIGKRFPPSAVVSELLKDKASGHHGSVDVYLSIRKDFHSDTQQENLLLCPKDIRKPEPKPKCP